ncbi:MAG: hypothetical protein JWR83_3349, partial [Aeromicrobium sp.]|nr:hypothetical protein [Aeromicrobium sp.]
ALTADAHNLALQGGNISEAAAYLARLANWRGDLLAQACAFHAGEFVASPSTSAAAGLAAGLLQRAGAHLGDLADQIEVVRRRVVGMEAPRNRGETASSGPEQQMLRNLNWPDVPDIPRIPFVDPPIPARVRLQWSTGEEWAEGVAIRRDHRYSHVRINDARLPGGLVWLNSKSVLPHDS